MSTGALSQTQYRRPWPQQQQCCSTKPESAAVPHPTPPGLSAKLCQCLPTQNTWPLELHGFST